MGSGFGRCQSVDSTNSESQEIPKSEKPSELEFPPSVLTLDDEFLVFLVVFPPQKFCWISLRFSKFHFGDSDSPSFPWILIKHHVMLVKTKK
jgi:hypothetical protein